MIADWPREKLVERLVHYQSLAALTLPRTADFPTVPGIDYHVFTEPYESCVGGDHLMVVNFERYGLSEMIRLAEEAGKKKRAEILRKSLDTLGIFILDVAGHKIGHNVPVNYLHGKFETGFRYEIITNGEITPNVFEITNEDYYHYIHQRAADFVSEGNILPVATFSFTEVHANGIVRYISGGHPTPRIFSRERGRMEILDGDRTQTSAQLGVLPSDYNPDISHFRRPSGKKKDKYLVNELHLQGKGDVMLLYTDGLTELNNGELNFCDTYLAQVLRETRDGTAREIYAAIMAKVMSVGKITDDLTLAVIKKT